MQAETHHFVTLDGMRGMAAVAVVTTHAVPFIGGPLLPSASPAVDLFFLLSGFVLTHAYSTRLDEGLSFLVSSPSALRDSSRST